MLASVRRSASVTASTALLLTTCCLALASSNSGGIVRLAQKIGPSVAGISSLMRRISSTLWGPGAVGELENGNGNRQNCSGDAVA